MTPRAESPSNGPSFVATSFGGISPLRTLLLNVDPSPGRLSGRLEKFFSCNVLPPGVQDRGSSTIILFYPFPEGRSHGVVTFAWFGRVGVSGLLENELDTALGLTG